MCIVKKINKIYIQDITAFTNLNVGIFAISYSFVLFFTITTESFKNFLDFFTCLICIKRPYLYKYIYIKDKSVYI